MIQGATELRQQVYLRLRDAIDAGTFAPGARVPASRDQARVLGVSRNTVLWALERLHAEGYLVARVGDGTYVSERAITPPPPRGAAVAAHQLLSRRGPAVAPTRLDWDPLPGPPPAFSTSHAALDEVPFAALARLAPPATPDSPPRCACH